MIKTLEKKEIYNKIVANKLLNGICLDLVEILSNNKDPITVGEIYSFYKIKYPKTQRSRNELAKRISDLCNWGVVKPFGTKRCPITNRSANVYVLTGNMPNKEAKNIQIIEQDSNRLELMNFLEQQINESHNTIKFVSILYMLANILFFIPSFRARLDRIVSNIYSLQQIAFNNLNELSIKQKRFRNRA